MFGIVNHNALIDQFGEDVTEELGTRFASLLLAKIGPHDCIGRYADERLVIISRGVTLAQCTHFAKRVCKSLHSGHITILGQHIKLAAGAGAVMASEHAMASGDELLTLTSQRLDRALSCGGNTVVADHQPHNVGLLLPKMLASLGDHDEKNMAARIGRLGLQILPLIAVMNKELSLGLQMPEIKRQLQQREKDENDTVSTVQSA
jgi:hypothetical protein